ncbi:P-loop containing nucleoside triphosphate hydrolase protein [Dioscorea alata]|uniref:P-loop containing nucleoside triphosphate hydrolase protein n=1 Tax=Dioscorea alata TaxID=55571 RepID=A0ACB7WM77_DIOAL|nr:P-loop containing nucleoside triphosphate hydrolase protein [Dioscorea alata]
MAESAVSQVATRLAGLLSQELWLLYGVRGEVEWMERELRRIKCFLKDADAKGKRDERVKNWVNDVIQVAYQAEDAIDTFLIKVDQSHGWLSRIKYWFKPSVLIARYNVGVEIGKIKERLNEIKASKETYGIQNLSEDGDASNLISIKPRRHFTSQYSDDADIVGLFNDQKILFEQLMDHRQQRLCVISIVGIGGLGKTTLARKLYRDNAVSNHFRKRIWVTVSQENSLIGLLRKMLEEVRKVEKEKLEKMEENDFIDMLNDSLRRQRFFIVLDDIWREDVWNQMQRSFPDVNNGSRVLITTRFLNVAKGADPRSTPYELPLLNDDESMKLLLKKAFPYEDAEANCTSELLDIGRRLMHKCGGLPLALVVLGGLLSIKDKTPVVWRRVLETMDWAAEGRLCQEILALSYEDLPYHMKSCFLYLGAYPEDYEITGNELIRQWIAEGFIPQEERKTMEDTGEAILEELIQRSLIHVNMRKNNGSVKKCGVHDLLLDFARSAAKKDLFLTVCSNENDQPTYLASSRRVAFHIVNVTKINEISRVSTMHGLRTLMAFGLPRLPIDSSIFRFELLRVLDLTELTYVQRLPKQIELLIHLRYLRLEHLSCLPSCVGNLQSLETVLLSELIEIPITLWKIRTLRHVQVLLCKPPQSLELKNLLTLENVAFGSYRTINWRFPNLRKLKVLINKEHQRTMLTHLLCGLHHLISLCIQAAEDFPIEINTKDFPFHNHLLSLTLFGFWPKGGEVSEFPTCLTKLELCLSRLEQDPMPKLERLQYLVTLKLSQSVYLGKTMLCSTGGFPSLKSLFITSLWPKKYTATLPVLWDEDAMPNLEEWRVERGAMPKLAFLKLTSCPMLKVFPDLQHVMSLQKLELGDMSQRLRLRLQRKAGEDWYKIQHVPKLTYRVLKPS